MTPEPLKGKNIGYDKNFGEHEYQRNGDYFNEDDIKFFLSFLR